MDRLDKIADAVTEIKVTLGRVETVLSRNTDDLFEHMRRTDLLEQKLNKIELPYTIARWTVGAAGFVYTVLKIWEVTHPQ